MIKTKFTHFFLGHLIFILLFILPYNAHSACDANGNITGANVITIILGAAGCATIGNSAIVDVAATITAATGGIVAPNQAWDILNNGTIDVGGIGIDLQQGGSIINNNFIRATGDALQLQNGGTVSNFGEIISTGGNGIFAAAAGPAVNVVNFSSITGATNGIDLENGGSIFNIGTITGTTTGITTANATSSIVNEGLISGTTGIILGAGGSISNFNSIIGSTAGIVTNGSMGFIQNNGLIGSLAGIGITMNAGGFVFNTAEGIISGATTHSIFINNDAGTVINAGWITGGSTAAIEMGAANSLVENTGIIEGNVIFNRSQDRFLMSAGQMSGNLIMGSEGNETAIFTDVTDLNNIGNIGIFNGGGGGEDQLIFNNSQHSGGSDLINWETITLNQGSSLILTSNLTLGGLSADQTATLNINASTLYARNGRNTLIQAQNISGLALVNNNGIINVMSDQANHTLTIRGNYIGTDGFLVVNSVVNGDNSPADKLVIDGNNIGSAAIGNTGVIVHNIGGQGALTTSNGILIVQAINQAITSPTAFNLASPLRVGAFDYRLLRGGITGDPNVQQNWYLRSTFINPIMLPIVGPELSVYGSILPTAMNSQRVTLGTLKERVGDESCLLTNHAPSAKRFDNGAWARTFTQPYQAQYSSIVKPLSSGTALGLQAGLDVYRDHTAGGALNIVGIYMASTHDHPDIDGIVTNDATTANIRKHTGNVMINSQTAGVYYTHFWHSGAYLDLVTHTSYHHGDAHSFRTNLPHLQGIGISSSAEFGYPFNITHRLVLEPETQLIYQFGHFNTAVDTFSAVTLGSSHELLGRIGARLKWDNFHCYLGTLQPFVRANIWSTLAGATATARYGKDIPTPDNSIATTARASWMQLGGGIDIKATKRVSFYSYADGLAAVHKGERFYNGFDAGLGLRINI